MSRQTPRPLFAATLLACAVSSFALISCSNDDPAPTTPTPGSEESDAPATEPAMSPPPAGSQSMPAGLTVDVAISRAESGLGFSYFWGGGCWSPGASAKGSCTGSCPSCTHSGTWGADCSGYMAKVWEVPSATAVTSCGHPYSTDTFYNEELLWKTIPRSQAKRGDAFVYRKDGAGHIFLFDSGDPWGSMMAYEAKGCSYGIVHDNRTASSDYKVIRRTGF